MTVTVPIPAAANPNAPIRAAVIGSGVISKEHLSYLGVSSRVRLVGVCDLSLAAARYAAETFGADAAYTDAATMLTEARPDVVHILTPPQSHVALAAMALEAGAHVVCEKPVAPTAPELLELLDLAARHGRVLMESQNYRFNEPVVELREQITSGALGAVREVEINMSLPIREPGGRLSDENMPSPLHSLPAGALHDFITHLAYLLVHLAPAVSYDRIAAAWSNHGGGDLFTYDDLDAILIGNGPAGPVHGRIRFDCGTAPDRFTIRVRGSRGSAETDLFHPHSHVEVPRVGGKQLSPIVNHLANGISLTGSGLRNFMQKLTQQGQYGGLHRMLDELYTVLQLGGTPPITPADMVEVSTLVDRLIEEKVRL